MLMVLMILLVVSYLTYLTLKYGIFDNMMYYSHAHFVQTLRVKDARVFISGCVIDTIQTPTDILSYATDEYEVCRYYKNHRLMNAFFTYEGDISKVKNWIKEHLGCTELHKLMTADCKFILSDVHGRLLYVYYKDNMCILHSFHRYDFLYTPYVLYSRLLEKK